MGYVAMIWNRSFSGWVTILVANAINNLQQYDKFQSMVLHKEELGIHDSDMKLCI